MSAALAPNRRGFDKGGRASARALLTAASLALCAGGIAIAAHGALVPIEAEVAQFQLDRSFDRALAANARAETPPDQPTLPPETAKMTAAPAARVRPAVQKVPAPSLLAGPTVRAEPVVTPPAPVAAIAAGRPLARITVKRLDVRDVVLAGPVSHDALAKGPMMVKRGDAASPVTVLAAHRDTHFLFIRDLREGDIVTLQYVTGEVQRYRVTHFETVRWNEFAYPLDPPRALLALTTCYPFGGSEYGGPWRRVAWAEAI